jgi:hypothetical protein
MNVPRSLILASMLVLTGCATPLTVSKECALPPPLPESVQQQADRQGPSYSEWAKPLLDWFVRQIETAPR